MGIEVRAKQVIGWKLEADLVLQWLQQHQVGSCDGDYIVQEDGKVVFASASEEQCLCGLDCWDAEKLKTLMPTDAQGNLVVHFVTASPHYGAGFTEMNLFLSLLPDGKHPVSKLLEANEHVAAAKEFRKQMYEWYENFNTNNQTASEKEKSGTKPKVVVDDYDDDDKRVKKDEFEDEPRIMAVLDWF